MPAYGRYTLFLLAAVLAVLVWSGIAPKDRLTWWMEVAPALLGLVVLAGMRRRFRFTPLLQTFIALHMILLAVGGWNVEHGGLSCDRHWLFYWIAASWHAHKA